MSISPQEDDESEDEREDAADDEADVMPEALEHKRAVDAKEESGEPVVNEDDKLAACWLPPLVVTIGIGTP